IGSVPENLSEHYPAGYYSFAPSQEGGFKRFLKRRRAAHLLETRSMIGRVVTWAFGVPELFDWIAGTGAGFDHRILDVGSGNGQLLLQLRDVGFRHLVGIDPFVAKDLHHPGGVQVLRRGIADAEGEFD